jgi:ribose transport system permease protein
MTEKMLAAPSRRRLQWTSLIRRIGWSRDQTWLFVGLLLLVGAFSLLSAPFRRGGNFVLILLETSAIGIVAAGQTLVVLTGGLDLSVGSIIALTGVVAALLMKQGIGPIPPVHPYVAIGFSLALGALIGLGHGLLIAKRNMPPFIVTLGSMGVLRGAALVATNASPINALPDQFKWISDAHVGGVPVPGLIMLVVFLIFGYALRNTKLGRYTYAIGGNETAARLSGVPTDRYKIYVYMLSGFLSALASVILIARIDCGIYTNGEGYELSSVAAVVIGGTSLQGGIGGVWGTLLGVLVMAVVRNGLVMLGISSLWHSIVIGSVILLAVFIDVERRRAQRAAPKIALRPAAARYSYSGEIIAQITQLIKSHLGSPYTRIYLIDPEIDNLVECRVDGSVATKAGSVANQVKATGQPATVDDLSAEKSEGIVPLDPRVHSAAAIPLTANGQMIGVLEVQSLAPYGFSRETVKQLTDLVQTATAPLKDAWLLERGWLAHQARDALRHLWDDVYLRRCPLAEWAFPEPNLSSESGPRMRSAQLRNLLVKAVKDLNNQAQSDPHAARRYDILHLTYIEGHTVNEVTHALSISRRQYFYDLKDALDALAHLLIAHRVEQ